MNNKLTNTITLSLTLILATLIYSPSPAQAESQISDSKTTWCYLLKIEGKADRIDSVVINKKEVLGGPVRSLKYPLDISGYVRSGLNSMKVTCFNAEKANKAEKPLAVIIQKRTPGPKIEAISRIEIPEAEFTRDHKVDFNLDLGLKDPDNRARKSNKPLKLEDRKEIKHIAEQYLIAISKKDCAALKRLYGPALQAEKRIRPEAARTFNQSLAAELKILRRKEISLKALPISEVILERSGATVYALGRDGKELVSGNLVKIKMPREVDGIEKQIDENSSFQLRKRCLRFRKIQDHWRLVFDASTNLQE